MLLEDFPNLLTDCTKALDMGPRNGGGAKRPYFFFMQPGKKVAVRNKLNPRTRGWQLQLQCTKRKKKTTKNGLKRSRIPDFGI